MTDGAESSAEQHIAKQLRAAGLHADFGPQIRALCDEGVITAEMDAAAAYSTFLLYKSKEHPVYQALLKNTYLFDITFDLPVDLIGSGADSEAPADAASATLEASLSVLADYVFVGTRSKDALFVGVKLSKSMLSSDCELSKAQLDPASILNAHLSAQSIAAAPRHLLPYYLILKNFRETTTIAFNELLIDDECSVPGEDVKKNCCELIAHLRDINIPLGIDSYDLLRPSSGILPVHDCILYMHASSQWPKDEEARACVKTAVYCQYYSKSPYGAAIEKDCVVLRYKDAFYRLKIYTKEDETVRHKISLVLQGIIESSGGAHAVRARLARRLLGRMGFYPLIVDDTFVDVAVLVAGKNTVGDAKFISSLLALDWDFSNKHLSLNSLKLRQDYGAASRTLRISHNDTHFFYSLPKDSCIEELRKAAQKLASSNTLLFEASKAGTLPLLPSIAVQPDAETRPHDFVLSKEPVEGSKPINGAYLSDFCLGVPAPTEFIGRRMHREARCYYDPSRELLAVKVNEGYDPVLVASVIITETSFRYIKWSEY
ncbi:hypothetical protein PAPHI01_0828 [Pancytospora philotis]|nr:hypothetical protein PAPHI01_0828 [Pancytospora philotis]